MLLFHESRLLSVKNPNFIQKMFLKIYVVCKLHIMEWLRMEDISGSYLVKSPAQDWPESNPGGFLISPKLETHNFPGHPVPVLGHPHHKKNPPGVQREPPVFRFSSLYSGPVTRHHWDEPDSLFFVPSLQMRDSSSPTLFASFQRSDAPVLSPASWPSAALTPECPCLSPTEEPRTEHRTDVASGVLIFSWCCKSIPQFVLCFLSNITNIIIFVEDIHFSAYLVFLY